MSRRFKLWLFIEALLPLCFMIIWWPMAKYMMSIPNAYEQIFSSGDLLPFCSLMLLGFFTSIFRNSQDNSGRLETLGLMSLVLGIVLLLLYGSMKTLSLLLENGKLPTGIVNKITFSNFSMACLVLTLSFSFYTQVALSRQR
jgi:hypothetical protein